MTVPGDMRDNVCRRKSNNLCLLFSSYTQKKKKKKRGMFASVDGNRDLLPVKQIQTPTNPLSLHTKLKAGSLSLLSKQ